ncbi:uncharacterized protein F5Z01DRAFT_25965 [Emericellopsis atlantica]|uniref:LrgB-like protein n=1 Tax=Emericellopsis atlantica TaxID=2614577 RepID=A0A9P7ZVH2_9HYPO|nr:uncharacterized protein F5Z01DRAFT_25965 [Emericellopsis atlantica]KAG9259114.1 hypothetical protein F5Z01DRAFT_25965 [Emericellopsis atlantica]
MKDYRKLCVDRCNRAVRGICNLLWIVGLFLASELLIWAISLGLRLVSIPFFASIIGMLAVFFLTTGFHLFNKRVESFYNASLKQKINFINTHMAVGFPIPLVMLDQSEMLDATQIGYIIANFLVTNVVSWTVTFAIGFLALHGYAILHDKWEARSQTPASERPLMAPPPVINLSFVGDGSTSNELHNPSSGTPSPFRNENTPATSVLDLAAPLSESTATTSKAPSSRRERRTTVHKIFEQYPSLLAMSFLLAIGVPVAAARGEVRVLDGCAVWFSWITTVRMQRLFKTSSACAKRPRLKNTIATTLNPVLLTTLLLTGYIHLRAVASPLYDLSQVQKLFSRGNSLYAVWTASVLQEPIASNKGAYFGAGDAALAFLEVGIVVWGFKLFECRKQLWSVAGVFTVTVSIGIAAANVFLSVGSAHLIGLDGPDSLSFAARSVTLALAKPAIETVGGNLAVNAAVVVSNGILGQLVYPFVLDRMGVRTDSAEKEDDRGLNEPDDPLTIATGIAIGINGAAMGVAYLYGTRSHAAPYAALSMTVFGVMTVVFTTVEPFKGVVLSRSGI